MNPLRSRAAHLAVELRELQKQIQAGPTADDILEDKATLDLIRELKSAVDAMRLLLWKYIDASASRCPRQADARRLNDATAMLKALGLNDHSQQGAVSFIDSVSEVVDRYHASRTGAA
jgi:hypothetical protein